MAKKNLTPEELQAKMDKKSSNCKIFFGTFTKALAVFLAVVVAWSLVTICFTGPSIGGGVVVNGGASDNGTSSEGGDDFGGDDFVTDDSGLTDDGTADDGTTDDGAADNGADDTNTPSGDNNGSSDNGGAAKPSSKADVVKLFNEVTAKAAKGSYKLTRTGKFVKPINVGSATDALNKIITGVDKNASLDTVVGGFLGIKKDPITAVVTNGKGEGFDGKYMIKAMTLTDADVTKVSVDGNKYTISIKDCQNPGASSALAHATNDYVTFPEVNASIAKEVGSAVKIVEGESKANYKNIVFTATIVDGKMTNLEYSYTFGATLKIKLTVMPANGTGEASITGKYTNITY